MYNREPQAVEEWRVVKWLLSVGPSASSGNLGPLRIAQAHELGVPYMLIVGDREVEDRSVSLRSRNGQRSLPLRQAVDEMVHAVEPPV